MQIIFSISFLSIITGLFGFVFYAFEGHKKYFRVATIATLLSFLTLTILIIWQAIIYDNNTANYLAHPCKILAWFMLAAYFYSEYKFKIRILGALLIPIITVLLLVPALSGQAAPVVQRTFSSSFFVTLHVLLLLASFTFFFLAFSMAIIYIIKTRALKSQKSRAIDEDLPSLGKLQKILIGTFKLGWMTMTAGLLITVLSLATSDGKLVFDAKIVLGFSLWFFYTILFLLYQTNKMGTRSLARGVTFFFLLVMGFWLAYSFNILGNQQVPPQQSNQVGE